MSTKRELLQTVEQQKEQLIRYQAKLKDVVRAYKGLQKEKEALEVSLTTLTSGHIKENKSGVAESNENIEESSLSVQSKTQTGDSSFQESASDTADPIGEYNGEGKEITIEDLQRNVRTLTIAMTTLTAEKKRIEASFQSDKKRLLVEKEKLEISLTEAIESKLSAVKDAEEKMQELRSRLIVGQHEREQNLQRSQVMLRELESKLATERSNCENTQAALEDLKIRQSQQQIVNQRLPDQYEKKVTDLQNELEQVRSRLQRAEMQAEEPPLLKKIQHQMQEMKMQHDEALHKECLRAATVEESARDLANAHEERVVTLENRLSELSQTVAEYDRTRNQDLRAQQRLKDKVAELAEENKKLASCCNAETYSNEEEDVNIIAQRLGKLKDQLIKANLRTSQPIDLESILECSIDSFHSRCHKEYDTLKEEFENYKLLSKQKSESSNKSYCNGECFSQLEELRDKVRTLTYASHKQADNHQQHTSEIQQELVTAKSTHEAQLQRLEGEGRAALAAVEQQLAAQQQRSLATLQERDAEITRLSKKIMELEKRTPQGSLGSLEATAALLSHVSGGSDGPLLHHLEEFARKDKDIMQLRREKRECETTMREVQMAALMRQQAMQDTIEALQEETERLKRNTSRKGENLEYLKNVVLQYMTSSDAVSRQLILNAIATILKFTDTETESVKQYNALWWWQPHRKGSSSLSIS